MPTAIGSPAGAAEGPKTKDSPALVLAALRRAPTVPPEDRELMRALIAKVNPDPSTFLSTEEFMTSLASLRPVDTDGDDE